MNCYFLDMENIPQSIHINSCVQFDEQDRIYVLYSKEQKDRYIGNIGAVRRRCRNTYGVEVKNGIKNALDFNLSMLIGVVIGECIKIGIQDINIVVVSNDKGYTTLQDSISMIQRAYKINIKLSFVPSIFVSYKPVRKLEDRKTTCLDSLLKSRDRSIIKRVFTEDDDEFIDDVYLCFKLASWNKSTVPKFLRKVFPDKVSTQIYQTLKYTPVENIKNKK